MSGRLLKLLYATADGALYEDPELGAAGWDGARVVPLDAARAVPLPEGADLMLLPDRAAVAWDPASGRPLRDVAARRGAGEPLLAVAATLPQGYTRTLLPAYRAEAGAPRLPLFGYTAVGVAGDGQIYAAALVTDRAYRWNPALYNDRTLPRRIKALRKRFPENRLVEHLSRCALEYRCLTAQNLFYGRWEAGLPVAPACNAACLGCLSQQPEGGCPSPQERIAFTPTVEEIAALGAMHLAEGIEPIVSFGQGCEGEPLTQSRLLAEAVAAVRARTSRGSVNLNTNGLDTAALRAVAAAGLDSVRVSLISVRDETYRAYHRPPGFALEDVRRSLAAAKEHGVYVSLNLLVMPGLTDREEEAAALKALLDEGTVDMVQLRNLNVDPAFLFSALPGRQGELLGIPALVDRLRARPGLAVGNYTHAPQAR
ncbi:MAG: radical SAM protein [Thermoanaerobacterales bacterium]|nr:radical SAM protein [Thermoanaerobacterales bacterium]